MLFFLKKDFLGLFYGSNGLASRVLLLLMGAFLFSILIKSEQNFIGYSYCNAVILVLMIFSSNLNLSEIFERDLNLGILELTASKMGSLKLILCKILSNWLFYSLPCAVVCPLAYMFFKTENLDLGLIYLVFISMSLVISMITVLFASLTAGLPNSNMLITILSLPIYIPALIGSGAMLTEENFEFINFVKMFLGICLILLPATIFCGKMAIKNLLED